LTSPDDPPNAVRFDSKPTKPPGVVFPFAVFILADVLALILVLEAWK